MRGLKAHSSEVTHTVLVRFDQSERADIYYVYWRHQNGHWQHKSVAGTSKKLAMPADELTVIASNSYGFSQSASLKLQAGRWIKSQP